MFMELLKIIHKINENPPMTAPLKGHTCIISSIIATSGNIVSHDKHEML